MSCTLIDNSSLVWSCDAYSDDAAAPPSPSSSTASKRKRRRGRKAAQAALLQNGSMTSAPADVLPPAPASPTAAVAAAAASGKDAAATSPVGVGVGEKPASFCSRRSLNELLSAKAGEAAEDPLAPMSTDPPRWLTHGRVRAAPEISVDVLPTPDGGSPDGAGAAVAVGNGSLCAPLSGSPVSRPAGSPMEALSGSFCSTTTAPAPLNALVRLEEEVPAFCDYVSLSKPEMRNRTDTRVVVQIAAQGVFCGSTVKVYGSHAYNAAVPSSDLDLVVEGCGAMTEERVTAFTTAVAASRHYTICASCLDGSATAFLCIMHNNTMLKTNITLHEGSSTVRRTAATVRRFFDRHPEALAVYKVLRMMLQQRGLRDVQSGGLGSYTLIVMLMAVVNEVETQHDGKDGDDVAAAAAATPTKDTDNDSACSETGSCWTSGGSLALTPAGSEEQRAARLLKNFLLFFSTFEYEEKTVTVSGGGCVATTPLSPATMKLDADCASSTYSSRGGESSETTQPPALTMRVLDPEDTSNNLAAPCTKQQEVIDTFKTAYASLVRYEANPATQEAFSPLSMLISSYL